MYLSPDAVNTLERILSLPPDHTGGRFVLGQEPPRGWMLREIDDYGLVDEIDVDWELTRVFADLLGQDLDFMRGPGFADAYPLDRARFGRVVQLYDLEVDFDEADWTLEVFANPSSPIGG